MYIPKEMWPDELKRYCCCCSVWEMAPLIRSHFWRGKINNCDVAHWRWCCWICALSNAGNRGYATLIPKVCRKWQKKSVGGKKKNVACHEIRCDVRPRRLFPSHRLSHQLRIHCEFEYFQEVGATAEWSTMGAAIIYRSIISLSKCEKCFARAERINCAPHARDV